MQKRLPGVSGFGLAFRFLFLKASGAILQRTNRKEKNLEYATGFCFDVPDILILMG